MYIGLGFGVDFGLGGDSRGDRLVIPYHLLAGPDHIATKTANDL